MLFNDAISIAKVLWASSGRIDNLPLPPRSPPNDTLIETALNALRRAGEGEESL